MIHMINMISDDICIITFQTKFTAAMAGDYQCTAKTDDHSAIDVAVVVVKPCRGDQFMCSDMVSDQSDQLM